MRSRLACVAVGMAACSGGGAPDVDSNASNVCDEIAEVACYNMYRCCAEGEIESFLGVSEPRTYDECRQDMQRLCERGLGILEWSIDEGRASFDASIMSACLEALVAPDDSCFTVDTMAPWEELCMETAWVGTVSAGGMCFFSYECAGEDSYCAPNQTCAVLPGNGQPCSPQGCASGLYCDLGTCRPQLGEGSVCTSTLQCAEDLFCNFALPTPVCTRLAGPGEPCTGPGSCERGSCIPGTCSNSPSSCFDDTDCSGRCADDQSACLDDGDCAAGMCSMTMTTCFDPTQCTGTGNVCVFPVMCVPGSCTGDIVCSTSVVVSDYCEDALGSLPLP